MAAPQRRSKLIRVLVTETELTELQQAAAAASQSVSTWQRTIGLKEARQNKRQVPMLSEATQHSLLTYLILRHPRPWRTEHDWTLEILDHNNCTVLSGLRAEEANEIIALANFLKIPNPHTEVAQ